MYIAFLWHMHQPYYIEFFTKVATLPWVRMHATKGYYDMVGLCKKFEEVHQNFNLVPSLLSQIERYNRKDIIDVFLELSKKDARELSKDERVFILKNFFMANAETMIKRYPRYFELFRKRGFYLDEKRILEVEPLFSVYDIRDLQVFFNLCWFGYRVFEEFQEARELKSKGRMFNEDDKREVIRIQEEVLKKIIQEYEKAQEDGLAEITTSPFYHPIMPLIFDTEIAKRCMPHANLPNRFSFPQDVEAQLKKAVTYYRQKFKRDPLGMWPSEGSVAPEIVPYLEKVGIKWIVTDEDILKMSLKAQRVGLKKYKPYRFQYKDTGIIILFRDKGLSNLISFTYGRYDSKESAKDLYTHIKNIQKNVSGDSIVTIALDGENPWENYPDGGKDFLSYLFELLAKDNSLTVTKISEYLEKMDTLDTLSDLHPGSWIEANFRIWIGSDEKNLAWEYLGRVRSYLEREKDIGEKRKRALEEIYIAEGSDWFWWYGDDFTSQNDEEFDRLFRTHLANVFKIVERDVPEYLLKPIISKKPIARIKEPVSFIHPIIDGIVSFYYEWEGAGIFDNTILSYSAMYNPKRYIKKLYFGFDLDNLYIRIDPSEIDTGIIFELNILAKSLYQIVFTAFPKKAEHFILYKREERGRIFLGRYKSIASNKIIELSVPFSILNLSSNENFKFYISVKRQKMEIERCPEDRPIKIEVPDENFEMYNWCV